MRYVALALSIIVGVMLFAQQQSFSDKGSGVVVLLYPPFDCRTDFDSELWAKYDSAMAQEWNISSQTMCIEGLDDWEKTELQVALQRIGKNVIAMSIDNIIIKGINDRAYGVAQPTENFGAVEFNYMESTKVLSHETLHLMLEEQGHSKSCYVDGVHENAYKYARYYDNILIVQHFDC